MSKWKEIFLLHLYLTYFWLDLIQKFIITKLLKIYFCCGNLNGTRTYKK